MFVCAEVPTEQQRGAPAAVRPDRAHAGVRAVAAHHAAGRARASLLQQAAPAPEARYALHMLITPPHTFCTRGCKQYASALLL